MSYIVGEVLMVRLYRKYEDREYRTEAKQVGTLYHVCTLDAFVNRIIEDKELGTKNNLHASGKYKNKLLDTYDAVSFTRDPLFVVPTWTVSDADILFQFVVDGDKLSEHYKVTPYSYTDGDPNKSEKEEVVIGPIKDFKSYIKEVRFDVKALSFKNTNQIIDELKKVKEYLGSIPCKRTTLPFLHATMKGWSHNYKKSLKEYDLYKVKTIDELISLLESIENVDIMDYIDSKDLLGRYVSQLSYSQIERIMREHPNWINKDWINQYLFSLSDDLLERIIKEHPEWIDKNSLEELFIHAIISKDPSIQIIKVCLENGLDINKEVEHEGYTAVPLEFVLLFNKNPLEVVKLLIEHGADIKKVSIRPIRNSCVYGGTGTASILKLFLENGLDPNEPSLKSYDGKSFIFQICSAENVIARYRKLELLLEHGANPNDTWNGYSLLPYVILQNEPMLAELIIRYGADVNIPPFSYADNPLKQAILKHNSSLIDLLIKKGADINSKESTLQTPLMKAIQSKIGYWTLLGFLEKGADVNAKDKTKRTPLDYAITYLDDPEEIVELLLDYGANPNEMKDQNPTGNKTVDDLLQKYRDKMNSKKEESISIKRMYRR